MSVFVIFVATLYVFSGGLSCEGESRLTAHYANVWGCLCKNFMWQYFRIYWIVYKVASLLFRGFILWCTHIFKIFIFGMKFRRLISSEIMNLGINIEQLFLCNQIFCMKKQFEATSCFQRNKPICYSILWLNLKQIHCINNSSTIFRTITKIIIQFIKEVLLFCMKIFFPRWAFGLIEMH